MEQGADLRRVRDPGRPDHRLVNSCWRFVPCASSPTCGFASKLNEVFDMLMSEFLPMEFFPPSILSLAALLNLS